MSKITVQFHSTGVGSISFDVNPVLLALHRSGTGFRMQLPIAISLRECPSTTHYQEKTPQQVLLSNIRGVLSGFRKDGQTVELGKVWDDRSYESPSPLDSPHQGQLTWQGNLADLVFFEQFRGVGDVRFKIDLEAELSLLIAVDKAYYSLRTDSKRVSGVADVTFPTEIWLDRLRGLGVLENVLVEIPLPSSPPSPWDQVWKSLKDARECFERGGPTGWRDCVTSVRVALSDWQKIEPEDLGEGEQRADRQQREERTKNQRIEAIRYFLHQFTHKAPHSTSEGWTRDDALLALSTLSALLAVRSRRDG